MAPNPVNFGNVHVGDVLLQSLSVENSAAGASEALDGSIGGATGAATTNGGSFTGLTEGNTDSSSLAVGLSSTTEGAESGTATVSLASDGTGIDNHGTTALTSQTVDVTGTVYALAAPVVTGTTLNFGEVRVGATVAASPSRSPTAAKPMRIRRA